MWTSEGFEPLPTAALRIRRIRSGIVIVVTIAVVTILDVSTRALSDLDLPVPPLAIPALVAVGLLAVWWTWTLLAWRAWGWRLDATTFQTRSGVYTKVWRGVARDRVQFVEVTAGPLQRWAGLASLVVRTAGVRTPAVRVEDLTQERAERLRDELNPRMRDATPGDDAAP